MNAWSQIYYDITRYDPQTQTRVSIPEVFVVSVPNYLVYLWPEFEFKAKRGKKGFFIMDLIEFRPAVIFTLVVDHEFRPFQRIPHPWALLMFFTGYKMTSFFQAPVTVPPKLFDTITQETRTVTIDSFQFKSVQERQTSVSPTKIVRSIQEEAARFPPTVLNASNKSVHEEKHKIVGDHHANYTYKFEYGEEHQQGKTQYVM